MGRCFRALVTIIFLITSLAVTGVGAGAASATPGSSPPAGSTGGTGAGPAPGLPSYEARVCGTPAAGHARCDTVQLLHPSRYWHPGNRAAARGGSGGTTGVPTPPSSGYYPADLLSAYGLASAASGERVGAETIAVVDAYDDPNAASDLAAYRASLSGATSTLGLKDGSIPPLCGSGSTPCVTFTKVNQSGGTSYPKSNTGWAEEISLDLDMASAICPACNIVLVEASSSSTSNLAQAVNEAKTFHPAAITNSYGGSEFSSEAGYNGVYSAAAGTAMTAASGDSGYGAEFPAASPGLTSVGGTTLMYSGNGASLQWNPQTAWSGAGSGCSADEAMPAWQGSQGVYSQSGVCSGRQVADVSADANPTTGVAAYDTFREGGWLVFGGTSVSAQIIGAAYAVAAGAGSVAPSPSALYPDTGGGTGPTPGLVPVTSGSNGNCGNYLCNAADHLSSGYDGPAGLGTPYGVGAFATGGGTTTAGSLSFAPASESLSSGAPAGPIAVDLSAAAPGGGLSVNLSASSVTGEFSTSPSGPWSTTLTLTVSGGATASQGLYYEDTTAGSVTLTASASGWASATQSDTVNPGPLSTISVSPSSASVGESGSQTFTATGHDAYGNLVVSGFDPTWTTTVSGGSVSPPSGTTTTFTAGSSSGSGFVTATQGGSSAHASVTVAALASMNVAVLAGKSVKKGPNYRTPLTVDATDASSGTAIGGASVALGVYSGSCPGSGTPSGNPVASGSGTTGSNGQATFTFTTRGTGPYCAEASATAGGYAAGTGTTGFTVPVS